MGTTRVKVIDLSSQNTEIKTARKHAEKLSGLGKLKQETKEKPEEAIAAPQADEQQESTQAAEEEALTEEKEVKETEPKSTKTDIKKARAKGQLKTHHQGSKYKNARKLLENKNYPLKEAFEILSKISYTKFDPTVEAYIHVSDKNVKGAVAMPFKKAQVKEKKYLIFSDRKITTDKKVIWADEKTTSDIEGGKLKPGKDFDTVVTVPKFMPSLTKIAKILGPKGLMPNPKNGTITENIEKLLEGEVSTSETPFRADPIGLVIPMTIGKLSQKQEELSSNLKALTTAIGQSKIKKASIKTTMSPQVRLDIATI